MAQHSLLAAFFPDTLQYILFDPREALTWLRGPKQMTSIEDYIMKVVHTLNICSPEKIARIPLIGFPQNLDTDDSSDQLFLAYAGILLFHHLDNLCLLLRTEHSLQIQQH